MGIFNHGKCILTSVLHKDVLYPRETVQLMSYIENQNCKKNVLKYTVRILRRIQVFMDDKNENVIPDEKNKANDKPLYVTDYTVWEQEFKANCKKLGYEE